MLGTSPGLGLGAWPCQKRDKCSLNYKYSAGKIGLKSRSCHFIMLIELATDNDRERTGGSLIMQLKLYTIKVRTSFLDTEVFLWYPSMQWETETDTSAFVSLSLYTLCISFPWKIQSMFLPYLMPRNILRIKYSTIAFSPVSLLLSPTLLFKSLTKAILFVFISIWVFLCQINCSINLWVCLYVLFMYCIFWLSHN